MTRSPVAKQEVSMPSSNAMTVRLRSKLLVMSLAVAVSLPYGAPSVCGLLDRMGADGEMIADAGDAGWQSPGSTGMCCNFNGCGVPHVAPLGYVVSDLRKLSVVQAELPGPPLSHPTNEISPLTPPPQA